MNNWDNINSEEIIIIREMLYDKPKNVLKKYGKDKLKAILIENFFQFDKKKFKFLENYFKNS